MDKIKLVIGPVNKKAPSWGYFYDITKQLEKFFNVTYFEIHPKERLENFDIAIIYKRLNHLKFVNAKKYIYFPIDWFKTTVQIEEEKDALKACSLVICSNPALEQYIKLYTQTTTILHNIKYYTEKPQQKYRHSGPIIWIGSWHYVPYLKEWWNENKPDWELLCLCSNRFNPEKEGFINKKQIEVFSWTPERHIKALAHSKAALDIKGESFWQRMKPATKVCEMIASGVATAIKGDTQKYFLDTLYLTNLATPEQKDWWFSEQYWEYTQIFSEKIRHDLCSKTQAKILHDLILSI